MEQFYLELMNIFNNKVYRLQKDKTSWRRLESDEIRESDFITSDPEEVISLQKRDCVIDLEGEKQKLISSPEGILDELFYKARVKRSRFPETPTKEQLISVIRSGIDDRDNALILNVDGMFELRDFQSLNLAVEDPTIILRYSTFYEGNDYVGEEAAKDIAFIDELYAKALEFWIWHLQNNSTNFFYEYERVQTVEESLEMIEEEKRKYEMEIG